MPTYNNKKQPKSRPNELAFLYATVQTLAYISCQLSSRSWERSFYKSFKDQRHRSTKIQDLVFCQRSSLFCMLIVFSIEHHLKPIHHHPFIHQRLKRPPNLNYRKFKTENWLVHSSHHFHSSQLKPIHTTSVIRTRTLSNLFAKRIVIPFCKCELHT